MFSTNYFRDWWFIYQIRTRQVYVVHMRANHSKLLPIRSSRSIVTMVTKLHSIVYEKLLVSQKLGVHNRKEWVVLQDNWITWNVDTDTHECTCKLRMHDFDERSGVTVHILFDIVCACLYFRYMFITNLTRRLSMSHMYKKHHLLTIVKQARSCCKNVQKHAIMSGAFKDKEKLF